MLYMDHNRRTLLADEFVNWLVLMFERKQCLCPPYSIQGLCGKELGQAQINRDIRIPEGYQQEALSGAFNPQRRHASGEA